MKYKVDLHVHSRYSEDNNSDPESSIQQAISLGLHGIAFTEHYFYKSSGPIERLKEIYRGRIIIFRGVEFSTAEGHCLVFGADTDLLVPTRAPVGDLIRIVNRAGGVVIPSHPYRKGTSLGDMVLRLEGLCALEGCNGFNMKAYNSMAIDMAKALGLPYTGGSDAHAPEEVGLCYTEFNREVTDENLIELLRSGDFQGVDNRPFPL